MGRIRTKLVKAKASELLEQHPDGFSQDFAENKRLVSERAQARSKKLRNKIAGLITKRSRT